MTEATLAYDEPFEDDEAQAEEAALEADGVVVDAPVPRITIEAFCERDATVSLVNRCADDRRLTRAHVQARGGGLSAAIDCYHDQPTPNLIIIETGMRGRALFAQLEELAAVCDPDTKVMIVGGVNDIVLYRELMKRGVSEYLVPPLSPVQLIRAITAIYAEADAPFCGKTIAFVAAKGGAGSSTVAHNISWSVSEDLSLDTCLVDLDLSFGTAGLDFNQDSIQGVGEALSQPERVDDVLLDRLVTRCTDRLNLFCAPAVLDRDWDLPIESYETVIQAIRKTTPIVTLDLPHRWSPWVKRTLLAADEVVVTATPDLAGLRNAKNLYELLANNRPNDGPPRVVLNQVGLPKRPEVPIKEFVEAVGAEPDIVLPFDAQLFGAATNNGVMVSEIKYDSPSAEAFRRLAAVLAGRQPPRVQRSILKRLLGVK